MHAKDKLPVTMRIRLKYPDVATFIEKYAPNVSKGGMFIQSRAPQPVGTQLRFEVLLQDETPLLKGEGVVIWVKEYDAAHPTRVHGMGIRFSELDAASEAMIERVLAAKGEESLASSARPRRRSQTQEVQALARDAATEGAPDELPEAAPCGAPASEPAAAPPPSIVPPAAGAATPSAGIAPPAMAASIPATPSAAVRAEEAAALAAAVEAGGDGVSVAIAMAEQVLCELMQGSGLREEQLAAAQVALCSGAARAGAGDEEFAALLEAAPQPPVTVEEALAGLAARGIPGLAPRMAPREEGVRGVVAPAAIPPPAAAPRAVVAEGVAVAPRPSVEEVVAAAAAPSLPLPPAPAPSPPPPSAAPEPFDPALLQAAARTARAVKAERSDRSFDLTDGSSGGADEFALPAVAPAAPAAQAAPAAAPDGGWGGLHTATELLDHGSSEVLRDMAQSASRGGLGEAVPDAEPAFVEHETTAEAVRAAASAIDDLIEAQPPFVRDGREAEEELALAAPTLRRGLQRPSAPRIEPLREPFSDEELQELEARRDATFVEPVEELAAEPEPLDVPPPPQRRGTRRGRPAFLDEPEEAETAPLVASDPEDLSREIWKEMVDEAAGELDRLDLCGDELSPQAALAPAGDDVDLNMDLGFSDDGESTQVTAAPTFDDRAAEPLRFVEPQGESSEGDMLPPDPDLDNEVFDALAGLRDTLDQERTATPRGAVAVEPPDAETVPSLEALVGSRPAPGVPEPEPAVNAPVINSIDVVADDPATPEPAPPKEIKPRKSGLFRRIFGKKS